MAGRFLTRYSGRLLAFCVGAWLLVVSLASPVFASSPLATAAENQELDPPGVFTDQLPSPIIDQFDGDDTVDNSTEDTETIFVPADYLKPEAESALRRLFLEDLENDVEPPADVETTAEDERPATIKARMPGLSDVELERYKRQMYRRDI